MTHDEIVPPPKVRIDRNEIEVIEGERGGIEYRVRRMFSEPIEWYANNGHITFKQRRAARKFYTLWFRGSQRSRYAMARYSETPGGDFDPDLFAAAELQYQAAREAIRGTKEREIAFNVCCMGEKAGRHGQMLYLRAALDDLIVHFDFT